MPTEAEMTSLLQEQKFLKWQIAQLVEEMQEKKGQRQSLETQHEKAQLHLHGFTSQGDAEGVKVATAQVDEIERALLEIQEAVPSLNQRMSSLQREHGLAIGAIHRVEAQAANTAERIKKLKHDLFLMKRKQDPDSPVVQNAIRTIQADLQVSEQRYIGLVGEVFPDEAA